MAARGQVSIHDLQRQMMEDDVRAERARTSRVLEGKTGGRANGRANGRADARTYKSSREKFDPHRLAPYPLTGASPNAVSPSGNPPAGNYRPGRQLDTHEILKHEMFASTSGSCDDHFEKNRPCPSAVYGVSDQYVILDTFEKVESSRPDKGEYQFNFMVQGVTRDQNIGVKDKLDTIIGIQVCEFCSPLLSFDNFDPADLVILNPALSQLGLAANGVLPITGDDVTNPQSQIPYCGRITMYLKEIGLQSYSDADNRRHHFEFHASPTGAENPPDYPDGDRLKLKPLDNCEYFLFTDPIQDIHGLTVCFYNPGNVIRFPPDCLYDAVAQTDGAQLLEFTYTDPTNLINLAVGDRIYIRGFATGTYPVLDAYVSRPEGHIVGAGGFTVTGPTLSGTTITFRLNPDISTAGLVPPIPANTVIASNQRIVICIAKNRMRIPLRFRRVIGRLTNYISP